MSDTVIEAATWFVNTCGEPDCACCATYVTFGDAESEPLVIARFGPDMARALASDLQQAADRMEAQQRRIEGRLS